jgi:hypothetical protein
MDALLKAAAITFVKIAAGDRIGAAVRRNGVAAGCAVAGAAFAAASIGCAVAALWVFVLPKVGPVGAPLIAAAALLSACLTLLAIMRSILRRRPTPLPAAVVPPAADPAVLIAEAMRLFDENKGAALLAAVLAGISAGSPGRK